MSFQRLNWLLQYALLRAAAWAIGLLPWETARRAGEKAGLIGSRLVRRRWELTLDNLRRAFPEEKEAILRAQAIQAWKNLGRVAAEMAVTSRAAAEELERLCRFENLDELRRVLAEGRGAVIHTGHFANWELIGVTLSAKGIPLSVIGRRIKNPYVDDWLRRIRTRFGLTMLSHKSPFFPIARALKRGQAVGILMDQSLPEGGVFVPFFGRPAATTTLTALLALKLKVPILPLELRREGSAVVGRFEKPLEIAEPTTEEQLTARLTMIIEGWIRRRPDQWFWLHNRWKRSPQPAERLQEARPD